MQCFKQITKYFYRKKVASQEKTNIDVKEYFKSLLGNYPKVTDKPITKIIDCQQDIKLGQFTEEEFNGVLIKIKSWEASDLHEIPPECVC